MNLSPQQLENIIEAAIMASDRPLTVTNLQKIFDPQDQPSTQEIKLAINSLRERYISSGVELKEVASGFRFQAKAELSPWIGKLWEERPPRYSRALLETMALIAYRQPITRAEIEDIRGVSTSSHIIKTLVEREWIQVVGQKEIPGRPELFGTTKSFLDYFNLNSLEELPPLAEIKDLESQAEQLQVQLELTAAPENTQVNTEENTQEYTQENPQRNTQENIQENTQEHTQENAASEIDSTTLNSEKIS